MCVMRENRVREIRASIMISLMVTHKHTHAHNSYAHSIQWQFAMMMWFTITISRSIEKHLASIVQNIWLIKYLGSKAETTEIPSIEKEGREKSRRAYTRQLLNQTKTGAMITLFMLSTLQCSRFAIVRYWPIGRVFELPPLTANQFSDRYKLNGFFFSLCDSALILERYWSFGYQIKWPLKWALLWSVIATTKISSITVLINFLYRLFIDLLTWESNWPQNVRRNGQDSRTNCKNNAILFGRTTFTIRSKHLINNWKNIYIDKASSMEVIMCFSSQVFWVFIWSTVLMLKSG